MESTLVVYDCVSGKFKYPESTSEQFVKKSENHPLWDIMREEGLASRNTVERFKNKIQEIAESEVPQVYFEEFFIKKSKRMWKWYRVGFICAEPGKTINLTFTDVDNETGSSRYMKKYGRDDLTGLLNRKAFCEAVRIIMEKNEEAVLNGQYALIYLDIIRFKAVNDIFGMEAGDRLLNYIADLLMHVLDEEAVISRTNSDRFVFFTRLSGKELEECVEKILDTVTDYDLPVEINCNAGIYVPGKEVLPVDLMIDRAILAHASIKGNYMKRYAYYTEELRENMLGEQEIAGMMNTALAEKQFLIYCQPQYNHSTKMLVGAEALVRWKHPERGLISPGIFIPIFEKNGFITKLDLYVFEEVCIFLKSCIDRKLPIVPISSNFSRQDIFQPDFADKLEEIRVKYGVPSRYLRVEITETAIVGNSDYVNEVVKKLHEYGYIVEMDDFGSGYSSLNVLKDIDLDIIKLDMLFLAEARDNKRGGTILSSIVRMAKWLGLPVIAEGVETLAQADFLKSIGCEYIQGYLYSRPLPQADYEAVLNKDEPGEIVSDADYIEQWSGNNFWNPTSMETLIFNNYVGGAAIFCYTSDEQIEILRVNEKYLSEICMNLSEKEVIHLNLVKVFDETNRKIYLDMIKRAIETEEEQECETWRTYTSRCGNEAICVRSNVRMIGKSQGSWLFYVMIRNITNEKRKYSEILDSERRFKMASEQANIYYWEYSVAEKVMRPCFRCMRDLGFPAVLTNYPESAIERGVFPPEVAEMYIDWHRQIAEGVPELEAIIPLTPDRIPFRVKYTTEYDDFGNAVKAYGSATLIVEE